VRDLPFRADGEEALFHAVRAADADNAVASDEVLLDAFGGREDARPLEPKVLRSALSSNSPARAVARPSTRTNVRAAGA
jgi:hypothetical protein